MTESLKSYISRIESLEETKSDISSDIKDIIQEAKSAGYDPKIIRLVVKLRKIDAAEREEQDQLVETYLREAGE